jgi:hypothetical protein
LAEVGAPDVVIFLRIARTQSFAPGDVVSSVDGSIVIEIARNRRDELVTHDMCIQDKLLSAMRFQFGGHIEKPSET